MLTERGYLAEEYAIYDGHLVSRAEYDDGAALIGGKPCRIPGAELRIRYLTPYNLLVASQECPVNNSPFDLRFEDIMNGILSGKATLDELAGEIRALPRPRLFNLH